MSITRLVLGLENYMNEPFFFLAIQLYVVTISEIHRYKYLQLACSFQVIKCEEIEAQIIIAIFFGLMYFKSTSELFAF